jgi:hypothetical protein
MTWHAIVLVMAFASGVTCGVLCVDAMVIWEVSR